MPDLTPSSNVLRKLGFNIPEDIPPDMNPDARKVYDEVVRRQQSKDPSWKKAARAGLSIPVEATRGFLGADPIEFEDLQKRIQSGKASAEDKAQFYSNFVGQLLGAGGDEVASGLTKAGVPLFHLLGNKKFVVHGTPKNFKNAAGELQEVFRPELYDKSDLLGHYTHTVRPKGDPLTYAERYAEGYKQFPANTRPTMYAIDADKDTFKNTLDLMGPDYNMDDLSQALAALSPSRRKGVLEDYRYRMRTEDPRSAKYELASHLKNALNEPENFKRLQPFDAIRVEDAGHETFALHPDSMFRSYYGKAPLTEKRPLTVTRLPEGIPADKTRSILKLDENRWQHTPLSQEDRPKPEYYKRGIEPPKTKSGFKNTPKGQAYQQKLDEAIAEAESKIYGKGIDTSPKSMPWEINDDYGKMSTSAASKLQTKPTTINELFKEGDKVMLPGQGDLSMTIRNQNDKLGAASHFLDDPDFTSQYHFTNDAGEPIALYDPQHYFNKEKSATPVGDEVDSLFEKFGNQPISLEQKPWEGKPAFEEKPEKQFGNWEYNPNIPVEHSLGDLWDNKSGMNYSQMDEAYAHMLADHNNIPLDKAKDIVANSSYNTIEEALQSKSNAVFHDKYPELKSQNVPFEPDTKDYGAILDKASNLGIDYHHMNNYDEIEAAIANAEATKNLPHIPMEKTVGTKLKEAAAKFGQAPSIYIPKNFEFLKTLGGSHGAELLKFGNDKMVFKPTKGFGDLAGMGEEYGSKIANLLNPKIPIAVRDELPGFGTGTLQKYFSGKPFDLNNYGALDAMDLGENHVIDWLIGNHDAHPGQFLRDRNNNIIPFDKGQAFKHWKDEIMSPSYHPNAAYGEKPPIYTNILQAYPSSAGNAAKSFAQNEVADRTGDITSLLGQYAVERFGSGTNDFYKFLTKQEDKLRTLPQDIEKYWSLSE